MKIWIKTAYLYNYKLIIIKSQTKFWEKQMKLLIISQNQEDKIAKITDFIKRQMN